MKSYGAMRFVAGVMKFFGWLTIIGGVLFFLLAFGGSQNVPNSPYVNSGMVFLISLLIGGLIVLIGIFTVAAGEMITAIADIATNSAHLARIAASAEKTVGFFDQISSRGSARTA